MTTTTHEARAAQDHGEPTEAQGQPGESEPIRTTIKKKKCVEPGMFDVDRLRCWMTGNGAAKG